MNQRTRSSDTHAPHESTFLSQFFAPGKVSVIVGAQWGDEGKGKWVDILGGMAPIIARYQGGNNAGHTIYQNGQKIVLHLLPSGVMHEQATLVLGAGVVIDPIALKSEWDRVNEILPLTPKRLKISARSHIITPYHVALDHRQEAIAVKPIGTTKRGIGPAYSTKADRSGIRMSQGIDKKTLEGWLSAQKNQDQDFATHYTSETNLWSRFHEAMAFITPFVSNTEVYLQESLAQGLPVLAEGAQGSMLDLAHGTYPYVTSSHTSAGGVACGLGVAPKAIGKVLGIAKAYCTRVGEGPFPSELFDEIGDQIGEKGQEFGATTGRKRRCGWFDAVAMRYSHGVNGFDGLVLNKLDVLYGLKEVGIITDYELDGAIVPFCPDVADLSRVKPRITYVPGFHDPDGAKAFVTQVERLTQIPVVGVGTSPHRDGLVWLA